MSQERKWLEEAKDLLWQAAGKVEAVLKKDGYTIDEMRRIRTFVLSIVRNNLDPLALGHAPDERRY
jgi:hypothetical protein